MIILSWRALGLELDTVQSTTTKKIQRAIFF
jgi:hypothetical protein